MLRQEKEWAAEAVEREAMFDEEERCIKAWEVAAVLASGMVNILNEVIDNLMWEHLEFLEWERERIRIELGEMALADAESELAMEAYRLSEQFAADQRQKHDEPRPLHLAHQLQDNKDLYMRRLFFQMHL